MYTKILNDPGTVYVPVRTSAYLRTSTYQLLPVRTSGTQCGGSAVQKNSHRRPSFRAFPASLEVSLQGLIKLAVVDFLHRCGTCGTILKERKRPQLAGKARSVVTWGAVLAVHKRLQFTTQHRHTNTITNTSEY